ncbi:MAG: hypothetical protein LIO42_02445 [Oscillospiraceae bacterium]|nr:hypothetical protein [Oscillospiraceae bacterium]
MKRSLISFALGLALLASLTGCSRDQAPDVTDSTDSASAVTDAADSAQGGDYSADEDGQVTDSGRLPEDIQSAGTDGAGGANLNSGGQSGAARRPIAREDTNGDETIMDDLVNDMEDGAEHVKQGVEQGIDDVKNGVSHMAGDVEQSAR